MLHRAIILKRSPLEGLGLFATEDIAAGEVIWHEEMTYRQYRREEIMAWPPAQRDFFLRYSFQIGERLHAGPENETELMADASNFMNHSCDPNTWFIDDETMTARRDIKAGEEVTYDYATSETRDSFSLECRCGSPLCRGVALGSDYWSRPELRARYGAHVMSHVLTPPGSASDRVDDAAAAGGAAPARS
jgi:SET domain-containing protein